MFRFYSSIILSYFVSTLLVAFFTARIMPKYIRWMREKQLGQTTLDDGPKWHKEKSGTPTMGGVVFLTAILVAIFVMSILSRFLLAKYFVIFFIFMFFGMIGFADDFIKVFRKQNAGLSGKQKFSLQVIGSILFVSLMLLCKLDATITLPFFGEINNVFLFSIFSIIWLTGFSNAVNLTDGLDGLAGTTTAIAYGAYGILGVVSGFYELAIVCFCVVGALMGFLKFNYKPAQIFMGDVGSLALGAGLAAISIMMHVEWSLLLIGIVFVCETASVMLQVTSFKLTGKRIFKMSPLHHHFELSGWSEKKIVMTFSVVGLVAAVIALLLIFIF